VTNEHDATLARFESRLATADAAHYTLLLFVTGTSDLSMRAIRNVRELCEAHLPDRYELQVIDVNRDASQMSKYDVVAAPTLIKVLPAPARMLVGDLSDTSRVLRALDILPVTDTTGGLDR
jgi:circadian clock protein KaiB